MGGGTEEMLLAGAKFPSGHAVLNDDFNLNLQILRLEFVRVAKRRWDVAEPMNL